MISKLKVEDGLRYIRILSVIGIILSGYFSLDVWINGGEKLLFLPIPFYFFILFSAMYAITFLSSEA